jgi:hypothetical protein
LPLRELVALKHLHASAEEAAWLIKRPWVIDYMIGRTESLLVFHLLFEALRTLTRNESDSPSVLSVGDRGDRGGERLNVRMNREMFMASSLYNASSYKT